MRNDSMTAVSYEWEPVASGLDYLIEVQPACDILGI